MYDEEMRMEHDDSVIVDHPERNTKQSKGKRFGTKGNKFRQRIYEQKRRNYKESQARHSQPNRIANRTEYVKRLRKTKQ